MRNQPRPESFPSAVRRRLRSRLLVRADLHVITRREVVFRFAIISLTHGHDHEFVELIFRALPDRFDPAAALTSGHRADRADVEIEHDAVFDFAFFGMPNMPCAWSNHARYPRAPSIFQSQADTHTSLRQPGRNPSSRRTPAPCSRSWRDLRLTESKHLHQNSTNFPTTFARRIISVTRSTRSVAVTLHANFRSGARRRRPASGIDRLAQHRRFRFDTADAPTNNPKTVDHRRVRISATSVSGK